MQMPSFMLPYQAVISYKWRSKLILDPIHIKVAIIILVPPGAAGSKLVPPGAEE
jgi:hypothetical protein